MSIVVRLGLRNHNLVESLWGYTCPEERVGVKIAYDLCDRIIGNLFEKLVSKRFHFLFCLHIILFSLINVLVISKGFVVFPLELGHQFFWFFRLFDESINDAHGIIHLLNHRHDLCGSPEVILAELMDDSDVVPTHFLEFFAKLSHFKLNRIYLLLFHF